MAIKKSVVDIAIKIADPILEELNLLLWDVVFQKDGSIFKLIYYVDKENGIGIDDCEAFSRAIDPLLDQHDFIQQSYVLEVSSPGVERSLTRDFHYDFLMDYKIKVGLFKAVDGSKSFVGQLISSDEDTFTIKLDDSSERTFFKKDCSSVKQYFEF